MLNENILWETCPDNLTLPANEVHVWRAPLDIPTADIACLERVLSPEEKKRTGRFYYDQDRQQSVAVRGMLKVLLGHYQQTDPCELQFHYGPYGKPRQHFPGKVLDLQFNLSHSANLVLYAFAIHRRLGIDVEHLASSIRYERIVKRYFSAQEQQFLDSLPEQSKRRAFFRHWTWKEAYSKACGRGISLALNPHYASVKPGEPIMLLPEYAHSQEINYSLLQELNPGEEFVGTIVVEGLDWRLKCWQWEKGLLRL